MVEKLSVGVVELWTINNILEVALHQNEIQKLTNVVSKYPDPN